MWASSSPSRAWAARLGIALVGILAISGCSQDGGASDASQQPSTAKGASAAAGNDPIVLLRTSLGELKIRLFSDKAPRTVINFMNYANSGHYDHTVFHQVEAGYAILGGGYDVDLVEKPSRYPIPCEADNGLRNRRGTIAMSRSLADLDSAKCQFIINLADNPSLDHRGDKPEEFGFCVFGEVVEGLEVLDLIAQVPVETRGSFHNVPTQAVTIEYARRIR